MSGMSFSNIKKILVFCEEDTFGIELQTMQSEGNFDVQIVNSFEAFERILENDVIHLIFLCADFGYEKIAEMTKSLFAHGIANVAKILVVDHETINERFEYFDLGITNFYERGQLSSLIEMIERIDKEETYRKSFKDMSIAILDDDKLQLKVLKDILDSNGIYNVDTFSHPYELLNADKAYDFYLIDLILPDIDGEIIMYEIRKQHENAVIIGISSIEKHSTIAKVLAIGANDYLVKPVNASVFMAKLYNYGKNLILKRENTMKTKVLQELASKDGLTTLYNHRHMQELLTKAVAQSKRHRRPLSLMMLDIDDFKLINDMHGHQFGDVVLSQVAKVLMNSIRDHDIVGRYGGEEFMIILPDTSLEAGMVIANRIRSEISKVCFEKDIIISLSGGIASLKTDGKQLIYDADCLLYEAKHTGKNKIIDKYEEIDIENAYETC